MEDKMLLFICIGILVLLGIVIIALSICYLYYGFRFFRKGYYYFESKEESSNSNKKRD